MTTKHTTELVIQASKNAIQAIGAETGHAVQNIAFCDTPERAAFIVNAVKNHKALVDLVQFAYDHLCEDEETLRNFEAVLAKVKEQQ